jgi:hypothetical protein
MRSFILRTLVLGVAAISAVLIAAPDKVAAQTVVFAPYGAHRGRIVIGPYRQKIWWGNGLTPYGAATIQHAFTVGGDVLTNENFLDAFTNLIREREAREATARELNECTKTLERARQTREALERELVSAKARTPAPAVADRDPALGRLGQEDAKAVEDYLKDFEKIAAKIDAVNQGPEVVKREGEELINRGDQLRNRLSERKKALEEVDRIVEQGNTALKSLLDSLDPPDGN